MLFLNVVLAKALKYPQKRDTGNLISKPAILSVDVKVTCVVRQLYEIADIFGT